MLQYINILMKFLLPLVAILNVYRFLDPKYLSFRTKCMWAILYKKYYSGTKTAHLPL
jgi:hypothetical protein